MKVLFLCTGNSCRSQMAEGYGHHLGQGLWEVKSAGLKTHGINPLAIAVMEEDGVNISHQKSTLLTEDLLKWSDLVITLCGDANENCPLLPKGKEKQHWPFEDPAKAKGSQEEILTEFRIIRDGIKLEVVNLLEKLKAENKISSYKPSFFSNSMKSLWDKPIIKYGAAATAIGGLFFISYKSLVNNKDSDTVRNLLPKPRL